MTDAPAPRPVLVLHVPADEPFVHGFLLPALGPSARGEAVIDARALEAARTAELDAALLASGVVIAVMTPAFLNNPWARQSEVLASDAAVDSRLDVVPLVLEPCELPLHLKYRIKLDCTRRQAWETEADRLRTYLARPVPVEVAPERPYPGMRPFSAAFAKYFFGRDSEIAAVIALITGGEREIYLIGPSGCGKSSLINAGVLPRLATQPGAAAPVVCTMRPGDAPLARLAECLGVAPATPVDAAAIAAWSASHPGAQLIVFVDQLEELFTLAPRAEADRFAASLAALRDEPHCLVLLALRADFYAELMQSALWRDGVRHVDLPALHGAALRDAIEKPARAVGVYLEPALVERLLADAAGEPGALPLLQETLLQLWDHRTRKLLTLAAYDALGEGGRSGLAVAISSRADGCLRELTPAQVVIARRLLLRLVSFGDGRPDTRRRQTRRQLAAGEAPAAFDPVLDRLTAARLVTTDGDAGTDVQVDLCHEVLIAAWPAFAAWAAAYRGDELRRRKLQASADDWIARGRGDSGLLDDGELAAAIAWRRTDAASALGESPEVTALIAASGAALDRARWRRRRWIAGAFAALIAFAAVTSTLAVIARRQANLAETRRLESLRKTGEQYRDVGRQAVVDGHHQRAVPYLVAARELGVYDIATQMLFHAATRSSVVFGLRHDQPVMAASFSRDGRRIVTASLDRTLRVWDAASGTVLAVLRHDQPVLAATQCGDGARIVTVSADSTARIWQLVAQPPPPIELHHDAQINTAACSGDGAIVVTASDDGTARTWSARTGEQLHAPLVHDAAVLSAAINRDGTRIVTTVSDGTSAGIWNVATGARVAALRKDWTDGSPRPGHVDLVGSATFSDDGSRVVTTSYDGTAVIWDAVTGAAAPPLSHGKWANLVSAAFRPDGAQLATVDGQGRVRIWEVASGASTGVAIDDAQVTTLSYSRDGTRLLGVSSDKVVRIWDAASGRVSAALDVEAGMRSAEFSPDGTRVVTAAFDGVARVWDVQPAGPRVLDSGSRLRYAAYSPDGTRIATTTDNGGVRLWSASGERLPELFPGVGAPDVVWDRNARWVAAIGIGGDAVIIDAATGKPRALHRVGGHNPTGGVTVKITIGHPPPRGAFSPDGRRFATTSGETSARIWDIESGEPVTPPLVHRGAVWTIRFDRDGRRALTASDDGTAQLWDASSGAPLGTLVHPAGVNVTSAVFSPDDTRIATVATDRVVRIWNTASLAVVHALTGHSDWIISAVFSPDGKRLVSHSTDNSARIWDVAGGKLAAPPLELSNYVNSIGFSGDGVRLVTASGPSVQIWETATGRPLTPPLVHPNFVRNAVFSGDGNALLTSGFDAVRIWDIAADTRSLDDWRRIARDSAFPQLRETLESLRQ